MRNGQSYLAASLCLGWVAVWGSEVLFWVTPPSGTDLVGLVLTWLAYSTAAGAVLSALVWSGLGGWRAAFLGGALLGYLVEGAVVATIYDAFPVQLVWTPLAWHGLITGLGVLAGGFALIRGGILRQLAGLVAIAVFGATWGLYWPLDNPVTGTLSQMLVYMGLSGALAAVALALLSRVPAVRPGRWWLWLAPLAMVALWSVGTVLAPAPQRLAGPAVVAATLWAMRRLGQGGAGPVFGPPLPWGRSLLCALAPVLTAVLAVAAWARFGGQPVNVPIALVSGAMGLGLWLWLLAQAALRRRA